MLMPHNFYIEKTCFERNTATRILQTSFRGCCPIAPSLSRQMCSKFFDKNTNNLKKLTTEISKIFRILRAER